MNNTAKTLNYSNGSISVDNLKFPNSFLKTDFPGYYVDPSVKLIHYQQNGNKNVVVKKDGSQENLTSYNKFYEDFINKAGEIALEYCNFNARKKQAAQIENLKSLIEFSSADLFEPGLSDKDQDKLIARIKKLNPNIAFNEAYFYDELKDLKKELLQESDYTQLPDVQDILSDKEKAAWIKYRAALRQLDKTKDPKSVRLPSKPESIS